MQNLKEKDQKCNKQRVQVYIENTEKEIYAVR
jgi:hypothetical protein